VKVTVLMHYFHLTREKDLLAMRDKEISELL
jgi:hypothetical protein